MFVDEAHRAGLGAWGAALALSLAVVVGPAGAAAQGEAAPSAATGTAAAPGGQATSSTPPPAAPASPTQAGTTQDVPPPPASAAPVAAPPVVVQELPVARVGALPPALEEELEFTVGALIEAASVQAAFMAGARGAVFYDGRQVLAFRRTGESRAFPYVPTTEPRERPVAEAIAQWLGPPTAYVAPAAPVAPAPAPAPVVAPPPGAPNAAAPQPGWEVPPGARRPVAPVRRDWRQLRTSARQSRPWRLRLAFLTLGTPRETYGEGPFLGPDSVLELFPALGAQLTASRYASSLMRFDLSLSLLWVAGNWTVDAQGPEGSLGAALMLVGRGRTRIGGGVGLDLLLAKEAELGGEDDFGWFAPRIRLLGELGWGGSSGFAVSIQLGPTFTFVPYAERFKGGFLFSVGVEFGVGGTAQAAPAADL